MNLRKCKYCFRTYDQRKYTRRGCCSYPCFEGFYTGFQRIVESKAKAKLLEPPKEIKSKKANKKFNRKKKVKKTKHNEDFYASRPWQELRYQALLKHGRKCQCCFATNIELHVDHVRPISKYPNLALDFNNLQVLCRACNLGKSNKDETDFR